MHQNTLRIDDWNAKMGTDAYKDGSATVGKYACGEVLLQRLRPLECSKQISHSDDSDTLYPHKGSGRTTTQCVVLDHDMYAMFSVLCYLSCHLVSGHILFHKVSPSQRWSALISLSICNIFLVASSLSRLCTCPCHLNLFSMQNNMECSIH